MKHSLPIAAIAFLSSFPALGQWSPYEKADAQLNAAYRALVDRVPNGERTTLRNAQRAWIANRNRLCGREARNSCAAKMTIARAHELDRQWVARFLPRVGQCFSTSVLEVGPRLEGDRDGSSGASISYRDGHFQVDYDSNPRKLGFRPGDSVRLCVVSLPQNCPLGDHRGVTYRTTNLTNGRTWAAADSGHECGGA